MAGSGWLRAFKVRRKRTESLNLGCDMVREAVLILFATRRCETGSG